MLRRSSKGAPDMKARKKLCVSVVGLVAFTVLSGRAAGPSTLVVTTAIANMASGFPLRVESDLKGTPQGSYVNTKQVTSTISTDDTWVLSTYSGPKFTPSD